VTYAVLQHFGQNAALAGVFTNSESLLDRLAEGHFKAGHAEAALHSKIMNIGIHRRAPPFCHPATAF
jgi:hypothetical protein